MGVVWRAFDTRLERHIALKLLPPGLTADPERRRRFLLEARAAATVTHPNIVTIHEIDEVAGITYHPALERATAEMGLSLRPRAGCVGIG